MASQLLCHIQRHHTPNDFLLQNDLMISGRRSGQSAVTIYPSFFKYGLQAEEPMSKIRLIYATRHFGAEQSTINSPGAQDWVARGGVLYVELDRHSSPPNWLNVGHATTSHATFGVNTNSPFVPQSGVMKVEGEVALKLTNLDEVWGRWEGSTDCAIGLKRFGKGAVVLIGTNVPPTSFDPTPGMNKYIFGNPGVNRNFQYLRLGHNVLTRPISNSGGDVTIPTKWLGASTEHWLMDLETGAFSEKQLAWKWWTLQGGYVFYVPSGKLLLSITNPNP